MRQKIYIFLKLLNIVKNTNYKILYIIYYIMNNLTEISRMTFESEGWFIGFRTWTLKAYDANNSLICTVNKNERHNYLKYVRFIMALREKGYKLRKCDREKLKSDEKNFLMKSYIPKATKSDLIEIAKIAGLSDYEINNIRNLTKLEHECIAEKLGLEYNELKDNLHKW